MSEDEARALARAAWEYLASNDRNFVSPEGDVDDDGLTCVTLDGNFDLVEMVKAIEAARVQLKGGEQ